MPDLKPLAITCNSTDCENGLHCFRATTSDPEVPQHGRCRDCGAELVDWDRVHDCDLGDIDHTIAVMQLELIRHHFWHLDMNQWAVNYALRKGRNGLREAIRNHLTKAIGPAEPFRDGAQTPREDKSRNPIHFAQHATASCCRRCIEEWHGFERGRDLTESEIDYLTELAFRYIDGRTPGLTDEAQRVPPIRQQAS